MQIYSSVQNFSYRELIQKVKGRSETVKTHHSLSVSLSCVHRLVLLRFTRSLIVTTFNRNESRHNSMQPDQLLIL